MRVAIFAETYFPFISGVVTHIQTLKDGLEEAGHKVLIVTLDPKARMHYVRDGVLYCPAISLKKIYGYGLANPVNLRRLKILKEFNPDIIHLHTEFSMGIFALFAAKRLKKPVVYTLHTMYDDYVYYLFPEHMSSVTKPAAHAYIRDVASKSTEIIGPSVKVVEYLHRCGVKRHINIVPNTVDVSAFMPESISQTATKNAQKKLGIQPDDISLIFVGRLGKEKSLDVLIDYFTKSFKGNEHFKLYIIGDGPDKDELATLIEHQGMKQQIRLMGKIDHNELPGFYNACDLFATASLSEMNSISLLEATASGLYAVQRLDIYNRDQIQPGKNGDVFTNPEEFAAIVQAYADMTPEQKNQRRDRVSAYARRYGRPEFTQKILNVYERAVDQYEP